MRRFLDAGLEASLGGEVGVSGDDLVDFLGCSLNVFSDSIISGSWLFPRAEHGRCGTFCKPPEWPTQQELQA